MNEKQFVILRGDVRLMEIAGIRLRDGEETQVLCQWPGGDMWVPLSCVGKVEPLNENDLPMFVAAEK